MQRMGHAFPRGFSLEVAPGGVGGDDLPVAFAHGLGDAVGDSIGKIVPMYRGGLCNNCARNYYRRKIRNIVAISIREKKG